MSQARTDYDTAAAEMDQHMRECDLCSVGIGCPTGDDTAERELRAFIALEHHNARTTGPRAPRRRNPC